MARASLGVAARSTVSAEAKLALLEELQRCSDAAAAAQSTAEWLRRPFDRRADDLRGARSPAGHAHRHRRMPASRRGKSKRLSLPLEEHKQSAHQRADKRRDRVVSQRERRARVLFGRQPLHVRQDRRRQHRRARNRTAAHQSCHRHAAGQRAMGVRCAEPLHSARWRRADGIWRRRPAAAARARAPLQHHQRGDRPDSVHEHGRAAHHRQRASRDALHRS